MESWFSGGFSRAASARAAVGLPKRRMAPGPYWVGGQKLGYQDAGSWTLFKSTPVEGETVDYDGLLQAWREGRVR